MSVGERIKFIRNLRGMTQKYLGMKVGFPERGADVRMTQYETGTRTPKADMTAALAHELDVSPMALDIPILESDLGLMHTLFALEDIYGIHIDEMNDEVCLRLDKSRGKTYFDVSKMLSAWQEQAAKLKAGEITKEEYDKWRYRYPEFDTTQIWAKVPSQRLSDDLVKRLNK